MREIEDELNYHMKKIEDSADKAISPLFMDIDLCSMCQMNQAHNCRGGLDCKEAKSIRLALSRKTRQGKKVEDEFWKVRGENERLRETLKGAIYSVRGSGYIGYAPNPIYTPQIGVETVEGWGEGYEFNA